MLNNKLLLKAIYKMVGEENMLDFMGDELTVDQRVEMIFQKIDQDGNEKITTEEFFEGVKKDPKLLKLMPMGQYKFDEESVSSEQASS